MPVSGTNISQVTLASNNVINVGSIGFYSAPYPSVATVTSVPPGGTVYIRATISDPFGSYDITGATIKITDPSGTVRQSSTTMGLPVYDSGAASKIYEYQPLSTVLSGAALGNWSISVTATEGTEGTVTNTAYATMPVVIPPVLTVVKSASPNPGVNPGGVVTYTIVITNTSAGAATSVVATDSLSPYVQWGLNSYGTGIAFQFVDGTPTSGLTLGTPVYSNNNGSTWVYTPVSGGGGARPGMTVTLLTGVSP